MNARKFKKRAKKGKRKVNRKKKRMEKKSLYNRKGEFEQSGTCGGIVIERLIKRAKYPNSGSRKGVSVKLFKTGRIVEAFCPLDGGVNYLEPNGEVKVRCMPKKDGFNLEIVEIERASLHKLHNYRPRGRRRKGSI